MKKDARFAIFVGAIVGLVCGVLVTVSWIIFKVSPLPSRFVFNSVFLFGLVGGGSFGLLISINRYLRIKIDRYTKDNSAFSIFEDKILDRPEVQKKVDELLSIRAKTCSEKNKALVRFRMEGLSICDLKNTSEVSEVTFAGYHTKYIAELSEAEGWFYMLYDIVKNRNQATYAGNHVLLRDRSWRKYLPEEKVSTPKVGSGVEG